MDGYRVESGELTAQANALAAIGDGVDGLVTSADRLAERLPQLGTAPPAQHLALRLREAAGRSGLSGEVGTATTELHSYHRALAETIASYLDVEERLS
ncbi:hypothetical protein Lesp02_39950 [Lentzea sp. NBRC 105346]|uniref:hypothetical protein n=1 Tax=Lentzea sp. NBRC 105346 TaxID=3032205 RepID=UPI0024A485B4|nr:hypothetical protein [Lentzea sp. NBRC 105346]GLZ31807.1 hypothetical protein Lesp02_39950 [Lentzea sp. NBRC 105346]